MVHGRALAARAPRMRLSPADACSPAAAAGRRELPFKTFVCRGRRRVPCGGTPPEGCRVSIVATTGIFFISLAIALYAN